MSDVLTRVADLCQVGTQWLFAKDMQVLVDSCQRLACMDVSATRDPDCLKSRMSQHVIVVVIDGDAKLVVLLVACGPFNLASISTADCHDLRSRNTIKQGMHMTLALKAY